MSDKLLESLDVFYGELTPARATVYARLEGLENTDGLTLCGFVRGPRCFYSKTLPATFRLQDAGPGPSLLAKALVPDPSYWSPDTPHIYDVTVELRKGENIIGSEVRQIGFKPLGISGRFFTWEGKPWVLRGVTNRTINADDISTWPDRSTSILFMNEPTDDQLEQASSRGILSWVVVFTMCRREVLEQQISRWSRWPSVAGVLLFSKHATDALDPALFSARTNILIGVPSSNPQTLPPAQRSRLFRFQLLKQNESPEWKLLSSDSPLAIVRELGTQPSYNLREFLAIEDARSAANKLQADLAPYGQFAGYIV